MQQLAAAIRQMIAISEQEMSDFLSRCSIRTFKKRDLLSRPGVVPDEIFFVNQGSLRVKILAQDGTEHTIHFALEHQFIADYSNFILRQPSVYSLEALEPLEVVVLPRAAVEWGYQHLAEGDKFGRLVAEYYFIYHDSRIQNQYVKTPKERYDAMSDLFPGIHNRAPQHMIASYLGITPIHLSRLKKAGRGAVGTRVGRVEQV